MFENRDFDDYVTRYLEDDLVIVYICCSPILTTTAKLLWNRTPPTVGGAGVKVTSIAAGACHSVKN